MTNTLRHKRNSLAYGFQPHRLGNGRRISSRGLAPPSRAPWSLHPADGNVARNVGNGESGEFSGKSLQCCERKKNTKESELLEKNVGARVGRRRANHSPCLEIAKVLFPQLRLFPDPLGGGARDGPSRLDECSAVQALACYHKGRPKCNRERKRESSSGAKFRI